VSVFATADEATLVRALVAGNGAARVELFDRYAPYVQRILARVLGPDPELADLLHEVLCRALDQIGTLDDPGALKAWLTSVAVFTAREQIRRRTRGRWLRFFAPEDVPEVPAIAAGEEIREALRATYAVLARLGAEDRIAFALRYVEGLELADVAAACGVSLNTVKRRLAAAERRFVALAGREPPLREWLEGGERWTRK